MESEYMALFLIWAGVIFRMAVPALRKYYEAMKDEDKEFKWSLRYTLATAIGLVVSFATTLVGFNMFEIPQDVTTLKFMVGAIIFAFGLDSIIIEIGEWAFEKRTE